MSKWARNVDGNQGEIVRELRARGVKVRLLHKAGEGIPDLLCGWRRKFFLLEVKTQHGTPEPSQVEFFDEFAGYPAFVVRTAQQALDAIGVP